MLKAVFSLAAMTLISVLVNLALVAQSNPYGIGFNLGNGSVEYITPLNPVYFKTSSGNLAFDFDSTSFKLIKSVNRGGSGQMLSLIPPGVAIEVNGAPVGSSNALNFEAGSGTLVTCTNNASGRVDCETSLNTAVALTVPKAQSGAPVYCGSTNGTSAYTCSLAAASALTAYTAGMTLLLNVDITCASSCTLNVDGVGAMSIKQIDGATDPGGALVANQPRWIAFNGTVWLLIA